jgi:IS30 family transposase
MVGMAKARPNHVNQPGRLRWNANTAKIQATTWMLRCFAPRLTTSWNRETRCAGRTPDQITTLPGQLRRSLTWDQGREMAQHAKFTVETGVPVFFCDPHSPWQRGTNENTNGLLRDYFPKGHDMRQWDQEHLDNVAAELNGRPRQTLEWMSPSQALDDALQ